MYLWVATIFCFIAVVGFGIAKYRQLELSHEAAIHTIASTTGILGEILLEKQFSTTLDNQRLESKLRSIIRLQTLVIATSDADVAGFDASAFEGICRLVSEQDRFFPAHSEDADKLQRPNTSQGDKAIDRLLHSLLNSLREPIKVESTWRSSRIGDQHKCPGFKQENQ